MQVAGQEHDDRDLGELGRLEGDAAEVDRQVGAVDLLPDPRQARQHGGQDRDRDDRVAVALEHRHAAVAQGDDRGREQDQADHHPLRLLARQHRFDAVDHHDPEARQHGHQREQVRVGVGQRETDHQVGRQAQAQEQQPVGQRQARGVVEREAGVRVRRVVLRLDEDRGEAARDEQGRREQAHELLVASAEHRPRVAAEAAADAVMTATLVRGVRPCHHRGGGPVGGACRCVCAPTMSQQPNRAVPAANG